MFAATKAAFRASASGPVPVLNLDLTSALDGRITFTRASSATYVNSSGLVASASANAARFDHTVAGVALGLLIEQARTNLALYSDDLTNAAWVKTNCTAAKTATGPDGVGNSASTLTATAGNATVLQSITSASAQRTTSCWIKRRSGSGTVEMTQNNGGTWTAVPVAAGWTRVAIAPAALANPIAGLRIATSGDAVDVALFQQEVGDCATSAIPTTSATAARAAESVSMTGTNFSSWYNTGAGTFIADAAPQFADNAVVEAYIFDAAASSVNYNKLGVYTAGARTGDPYYAFRNSGAQAVEGDNGAFVSGVHTKAAAGWDGGTLVVAANGAAPDTAAQTGSNPAPTALYIGHDRAIAAHINGWIRSLKFYNTRLDNADLQALTA